MASFKLNTKNMQVTLISKDTIKDGQKIAQWARELILSADAKTESSEQGYTLSAPHLDCYAPYSIVLNFNNYHFTDIKFWLKLCKGRV